MNERKVILYISMSLDGYIATKDNDLSFLDAVAHEGEDYGYFDFVNSTDAVIIGRNTYQKVIDMGYEYPHKDKEVYIITRTPQPAIGNLSFYTGDLKELVTKLKAKKGKDIYCDGGAQVANMLLQHRLIDELIISVIPVLLGDGIKLFAPNNPTQQLQLISTKNFEKGLVQLHYNVLPL
jgi:dihydrofolate reductase